MSNCIIHNEKKFFRVKLSFAIRKNYYFFDYFIKIHDKLIQYTKQEFSNIDELISLQKRNFEHIYLEEEQFKKYLKININTPDQVKKKEPLSDILEDFIENREYITEFYIHCGVERNKVELLKKHNKNVQKLVKQDNLLYKLYRQYEKNADETIKVKKEFLILATNYILSKYEIISEEQLLRVTTALTLEDILLNKSEIEDSYLPNIYKIDEKIKTHSVDVISFLPKTREFQCDIVYNLMKNHHEKPDGSGYPFHLKHYHFDVFMASRYIAERYVDLMIENEFKINKLPYIFNEINEEISQYKSTNFKKALELFNLAFKEGFKIG